MYKPQHTYIHMVWNQIGFGGVSDAPEPCFDERLHVLEKVKLSHIPLEQSQKEVGMLTFLLGCVMLGHSNIQNQDPPKSCKDTLCFT